jgi:hypothetical protein
MNLRDRHHFFQFECIQMSDKNFKILENGLNLKTNLCTVQLVMSFFETHI